MNKLKFKLVATAGIGKKNGVTNYKPVFIPKRVLGLTEIANIIQDKSSPSSSDVFNIIFALAPILHKSLQQGVVVDLGPLGRFSQTVVATEPITGLSGNNHLVRFHRVTYRPEASIRRSLTFNEYVQRKENKLVDMDDAYFEKATMELLDHYDFLYPGLLRDEFPLGNTRIQRILKSLVERGMLTKKKVGPRYYYYANR